MKNTPYISGTCIRQDILELVLKWITNATDGKKDEYKKAGKLLKGAKIGLKELYKMELPLKSKIKYTTLALFGAKIHCRLYALLKKKLN